MIFYGEIIKYAVLAGVAAGGAYLAWRYRHRINQQVNQWLSNNNLTKAALIEVKVRYDRVSVAARNITRRLFVSTSQIREAKIFEETLSLDQLSQRDPELYKSLEGRQFLDQDILEQFQ